MKKYTIIHYYDAAIAVEVLASDEDEAREAANAVYYDPNDMRLERNGSEIIDATEVPELSELIEKAENIIKEAEQEDTEVKLNPWPTVTTEWWNGDYMEYRHQTISNIFWDYDRNEIGFQTSESAADYGLSEIPDIEQHNICTQIINDVKL